MGILFSLFLFILVYIHYSIICFVLLYFLSQLAADPLAPLSQPRRGPRPPLWKPPFYGIALKKQQHGSHL